MLIIPASQQLSSNWSGGTTTQLFIFPEGSTYAERNFLFRISTATVETETSTFTSLPGFQRILMILNGSLVITHEDHHTKTLHTYDTDCFDGAWETSAIGKVTDFNLMMATGVKGQCKHEFVESTQSVTIPVECNFYGIYWLHGNAILTCNKESHELKERDFICVENPKSFIISSEERCDWVSIEVDFLA